ncbi:hypothetical protein B0A49_01372 [Cryomyces minteri]|uniref:Uncharacterized protein n=1 Tax=Cryomyces minteri TaxID=331657 RepID=A0A4U0XS11_9PEZI|nr:hypothetical protein B0A49_01372 [Cryomyces minteri]
MDHNAGLPDSRTFDMSSAEELVVEFPGLGQIVTKEHNSVEPAERGEITKPSEPTEPSEPYEQHKPIEPASSSKSFERPHPAANNITSSVLPISQIVPSALQARKTVETASPARETVRNVSRAPTKAWSIPWAPKTATTTTAGARAAGTSELKPAETPTTAWTARQAATTALPGGHTAPAHKSALALPASPTAIAKPWAPFPTYPVLLPDPDIALGGMTRPAAKGWWAPGCVEAGRAAREMGGWPEDGVLRNL